MGGAWSAWVDDVAALLLPERCAACDEVLADPGGLFCETCVALAAEVERPCAVCGEPHAAPACEGCDAAAPWRALAVFEHEGAVARAIHRFKYEDRSELARPLGRRLARQLGHVTSGVVVPVPLHPSRFRARGYCQASLLAAEVAGQLCLSVEPRWLERVRPTAKQMELHQVDRASNVAGAFRAGAVAAGTPVLLIDDVLTTGATARECARVLRRAGAGPVLIATVARARREDRATPSRT